MSATLKGPVLLQRFCIQVLHCRRHLSAALLFHKDYELLIVEDEFHGPSTGAAG